MKQCLIMILSIILILTVVIPTDAFKDGSRLGQVVSEAGRSLPEVAIGATGESEHDDYTTTDRGSNYRLIPAFWAGARSWSYYNNQIVSPAASDLEDIVYKALSAEPTGLQRALQAYDGQATKLKRVLSPEKQQVLMASMAEIRKAATQKDYIAVALEAPEAYLILIGSLDREALKVPIEVFLMNYAGFKLTALVRAKSEDWKKMQDVSWDAQRNWNAIRSSVKNSSLRDAVDTAINGMRNSSLSRNSETALLSTSIELSLINLLKANF